MSIFANCPEIKLGVQYERLLVLVTALKLIELEGGRPDDRVKMMHERGHQSEPEPIVLRRCYDTYINLIYTRGKSGDMVSLALDITASINHEQKLQEAQQRAAAASRAEIDLSGEYEPRNSNSVEWCGRDVRVIAGYLNDGRATALFQYGKTFHRGAVGNCQ